MKPPQRRRAAPARYLGEVIGSAAWSAREKRQLLRLLQARRGQPEPDAADLARELPGRSEAEIRDFLRQLKGRVVREAIQRVHPGGSKGARCRETQTPAPIEVWMDLAEKITEGDLQVDFEKIYKYLSSISRSCHGPELSAAESAVVLDLLMALPEELPHLPCTALAEHMLDTYQRLTAPQSDPSGGNLGPGAEDCETGSGGQEDADQATPQAPENAGPGEPKSAWQAAGVCPLNPFLVPLELLGRVATPEK
ncbi:small nuclear RNA activating complex polypeptide 2 [Rhinolophus ferrumequinum]|uniref:Small nuclear RNA activating complex polypeptide 2 n=1 Tax=Rhinolophus ferrumequinum TaxID=59479 RepID=A0A7J7U2U7_RHIFE|nr:small nuclear RNA activating complex polypeptide 2 [Rhinolophus ferrumequinum]